MAIEAGGIVNNAPDAERVGRCARLFVATLFQRDQRVQQAHRRWQTRMVLDDARATVAGTDSHSPPLIIDGLLTDLHDLGKLAADLGLKSYKWLPVALLFEFARAERVMIPPSALAMTSQARSVGGLRFMITVPADSPVVEDWLPPTVDRRAWASVGRVPKNGAKQQDPLPRDVLWFYRTKVKRPADAIYKIGREWARAEGLGNASQRSTVQNAIGRVHTYLEAINHQFPVSGSM